MGKRNLLSKMQPTGFQKSVHNVANLRLPPAKNSNLIACQVSKYKITIFIYIYIYMCVCVQYVHIHADTSFRPTSLLGLRFSGFRIRILGFRCFAFGVVSLISHVFFDVFGV